MTENKPAKTDFNENQADHANMDLKSMAEDIKRIRGELHFIYISYVIAFIIAVLSFLIFPFIMAK